MTQFNDKTKEQDFELLSEQLKALQIVANKTNGHSVFELKNGHKIVCGIKETMVIENGSIRRTIIYTPIEWFYL
jgi:hypothetical protein